MGRKSQVYKIWREANAVAIRIARAYSIKSNIAICGYHGWHDWYLSTNLSDKKIWIAI